MTLRNATLRNRAMYRNQYYVGDMLNGDTHGGLEIKYHIKYTGGANVTDPPTLYEFPETEVSLVELAVPNPRFGQDIPDTEPPEPEPEWIAPTSVAQIEAFCATLTWDEWVADDAPFILNVIDTWTWAARTASDEVGDPPVTTDRRIPGTGAVGTPCEIKLEDVQPIGLSGEVGGFDQHQFGLPIGEARWLMLRQPEATRTPPDGFETYVSDIAIRPTGGADDDVLIIIPDQRPPEP